MGNRRKARESALQILFQLEFDETQPSVVIQTFWQNRRANAEVKEFCRELVGGVLSHKEEIDKRIQAVSAHWRLERMALIDRNILRIAGFELAYGDDRPPAIIINEAVEIAKKYSSDKAPHFVNGILDALMENGDDESKSLREDNNG